MKPEPDLNEMETETATCPVCRESIQIPLHAVDDEGNFSVQCMRCKIPVSGKVKRDAGTL